MADVDKEREAFLAKIGQVELSEKEQYCWSKD